MYDVQFNGQPRQFYNDADPPLARRLNRAFEQIAINPHQHPNVKRLTGDWAGYWRYRVGDWRVVYSIDRQANIVLLVLIAHRREVY